MFLPLIGLGLSRCLCLSCPRWAAVGRPEPPDISPSGQFEAPSVRWCAGSPLSGLSLTARQEESRRGLALSDRAAARTHQSQEAIAERENVLEIRGGGRGQPRQQRQQPSASFK